MLKRIKFKHILIYSALFLFFLFLTFPWQNLRSLIFKEIYKTTRIAVSATSMSPAIFGWPGLSFETVNVSIPMGRNKIQLSAEELTARIGLGGLFPPAPAISVFIDNLEKGGDIYAKFSVSEPEYDAYLELDEVDLSQIQLSGVPNILNGLLEGDTDFTYNQSDLAKSIGEIHLKVSKLNTNKQNFEWFVLPPLNLHSMVVNIPVKNGIAEFKEVKFGNARSDIQGNLTGNLKLGKDWLRSHFKATLKIQISETLRNNPSAATLVSFLKTFESTNNPGHYGLRWDATFAQMQADLLGKALPKKVE